MKKRILFLAAAVSTLLAASCTKEAQTETVTPAGMREVTITASVDQATKTSYDDAGKFSWTKGDQISVLGDDDVFYTFTANQSAASSTFTGYVEEGVTLVGQALFPADPNTRRDGNNCYFYIPEYKDLSESGSADIPMGAYAEDNVYQFKHMGGAALFTFANFPADVVAAKVTFTNDYCKLNGEYVATFGEDTPWSYNAEDINPEKTNGVYTRKVKVTNNSAQVYLPYSAGATIWNEINIKVVGVFADGKEVVLLNTATKTTLPEFERAKLQKITPVELPDYVDLDGIDWTGANVATYKMPEGFTYFVQWTEMNAVADAKYLYVRLTAPKATWASNYISYAIGDANSTENLWFWGDAFTYTTFSDTGELRAKMDGFNFGLTYNGKDVVVKTDEGSENVVWSIAFPRNAHEVTNKSGEVKIGFYSDQDWTDKGIIPAAWGELMKVTLP